MSRNEELNEGIDVSSANESDVNENIVDTNLNEPNSLNVATSTSLSEGDNVVYPDNVKAIVDNTLNLNNQQPPGIQNLNLSTLPNLRPSTSAQPIKIPNISSLPNIKPTITHMPQTIQSSNIPMLSSVKPNITNVQLPMRQTFTSSLLSNQSNITPRLTPIVNQQKIVTPSLPGMSHLMPQQSNPSLVRASGTGNITGAPQIPSLTTQQNISGSGIPQIPPLTSQQRSIVPQISPLQPQQNNPPMLNQQRSSIPYLSPVGSQQHVQQPPYIPNAAQQHVQQPPYIPQLSNVNMPQNFTPQLTSTNVQGGPTAPYIPSTNAVQPMGLQTFSNLGGGQTYTPIMPNIFKTNPLVVNKEEEVEETEPVGEEDIIEYKPIEPIQLTRLPYKKASGLPTRKTLEDLGVKVKDIIDRRSRKSYEERSERYDRRDRSDKYDRQDRQESNIDRYSQYDKYSDGRKKVDYKQLRTRPPIAATILEFPNLPITQYAEDIYKAIVAYPVIAIDSPTGTGKTTYLPWYFANMNLKVRVSIPTIVSVMASYKFVYERSNFDVGYAAGREINYDDNTIIVYGTTGHFVQKLLSLISKGKLSYAKKLFGDVFIIDEVHTATVDITVLIGLFKFIFNDSADSPKLIFTSATYNADLIDPFYTNYPIIKLDESSRFNVDVIYLSRNEKFNSLKDDPNALIVKVLEEELGKNKEGHIIVFRPGAYEVLTTVTYIQSKIKDVSVFPIYSNMPTEEQNQIFSSTDKVKIIVGTNIIESSITVPDVRVVIDDMLEKISCISKTGGFKLLLKNISISASNQRKGRTGRTMEGICYRLCSQDYFETLDTYATIEIKRVPIHKYILKLIHSNLDSLDILKISEDSYRDSLDLLLKYRLIEIEDDNIKITGPGIFVSEMPLSIYSSILLGNIYDMYINNVGTTEVQFLLVCGIAVCSMIDHYDGVGFFNIYTKKPGQSDFDYNKSLSDIDEEFHKRFKGRTDIHTFVNIFCDMENKIMSSRSHDDFNLKEATAYVREYANINHMNGRKLKEVYKTMENIESTILKRFIREDIRLHDSIIDTVLTLNISEIICKLFNSVYTFNKIMQTGVDKNKKYILIDSDMEINLNKYSYNEIKSLQFYAAEIIEIAGMNKTRYIASIISDDVGS